MHGVKKLTLLVGMALALAGILYGLPGAKAAARSNGGTLTVTLSIDSLIALDLQEDGLINDGHDEIKVDYTLQDINNLSNGGSGVWGPFNMRTGDHYTTSDFAPISIEISEDSAIQVTISVTETEDRSSNNTSFPGPGTLTFQGRELLAGVVRTITFEWYGNLNHAEYEITFSLSAAAAKVPCWSNFPNTGQPDGTRQIAFYSDCEGNDDIYVIGADGSSIWRVIDDPAGDGYPVWSPDGNFMAFVSTRNNDTLDLFVANADGSDAHQITNNEDTEWLLSWSPDGTQIAFSSDRDGDEEIYVIDADGENIRQVTDNTVNDGYPRWSPDGTQIVYYSNLDGEYDIYVMDADGQNAKLLTQNTADDGYPAWSPDGKYIVFVSEPEGDSEIFVMDADGSNVRRLTTDSAGDITPSWSPDGTQIAFISDRDGDREVFVMDADGSNVQQLTANSSDEHMPTWLPDVQAASAAQPNEEMQIGEIIIQDARVESILGVNSMMLPNCSGSSALDVSKTFTKSIERELTFDVSADLNAEFNASFWNSAHLRLEAELEAKLGLKTKETLTEEITVEMHAAPGTTVTYEVEWVEMAVSGLLEVIDGDQIVYVPFSIPDTLHVNIQQPYQEDCPE
jgi:Tol biopolymer transport system component